MFDPKKPMGFDPTKPVITRSGLPARIICTDSKAYCVSGGKQVFLPIIAILTDRGGVEFCNDRYQANGIWGPTPQPTERDLINIKVKKWIWVITQGVMDNPASQKARVTPCPMTEEEVKSFYGSRVIGRVQETLTEE